MAAQPSLPGTTLSARPFCQTTTRLEPRLIKWPPTQPPRPCNLILCCCYCNKLALMPERLPVPGQPCCPGRGGFRPPGCSAPPRRSSRPAGPCSGCRPGAAGWRTAVLQARWGAELQTVLQAGTPLQARSAETAAGQEDPARAGSAHLGSKLRGKQEKLLKWSTSVLIKVNMA